jgi:two-component system CheB/CheR fusion protein
MPIKKKKAGTRPPTGAKEDRKDTRKKEKAAGEARRKSDARPQEQAGPAEPADHQTPFPIVGIGASAGGLEALEAFFENLPAESGIAFVVITHTDPKRISLLPSIIRRKTKVAVKQIEEAMPVEPNTVYLPPSNRDAFVREEIFHLKKRPNRVEVHMPVDLFFKHLAKERGERAACIILSGTGTDGTHGLRAIKEKSGVVMVQDPESARHTGMPASALDTGLVDCVVSPAEMPGRLIEYFRNPVSIVPAENKRKKAPDSINRILTFLANRTRHDFSLYKNGTLARRIARRMTVTRSQDASAYLQVLYRDDRELRALFQDLLIGVTSFFRDPDAFSYLKEHVLPDMFARKNGGENLRVWVPGCATGEEAYSVAIIFKEYMEEKHVLRQMQIFGTDIDPKAIEKARAGEYLQNIVVDVSAGRLKRFFIKEGDRYRIKREIREQVVFAEQNILRDPPFTDLDLLVCRNLLIYLKSEAQDKLIPLFHYTLKKDGILFLGNSETFGRFPELFEPLSTLHSIFRKRETAVRPQVHFPTGKIGALSPGKESAAGRDAHAADQAGVARAVEEVLLEEFIPACVIVNQSGEILHTRGRTGKYLELGPGKPNLNIANMAREGLRFSLLSALRKVKDAKGPIREKGLRVEINGEHRSIDLTVKGFSRPPLKDAVMVVFEESPASEKKVEKSDASQGDAADKDRIEALEQELLRVREDYRSTMEELETSNEELRSTNEEMQSSNEELQSTNEELESSREELQSLNEELNTVNSELQNKIQELDDSYQVVTDALNSTRIAIVYLDNDLRIARFTREATRLINLIDSDLGRPLAHISDNLDFENLCEKAGGVLKNLTPFEDEVKTKDGHWYRMNIMIHRKESHVIEGVVLTFVNVDVQKKSQQEIVEMKTREIRSIRRFAENIVDTVGESLLVLDEQMHVITANPRFYKTFETDPKLTEGKSLFELGNGQWDIAKLRKLLKQTIEQHKTFTDYRVEHRFAKIGFKKMLLNARLLQEDQPDENKVLLAIEDVTDK